MAWEIKGQGFDTAGLAIAYSLGGLSLSLDICCVGVTVETGNRENRSHHVHNQPVQHNMHVERKNNTSYGNIF